MSVFFILLTSNLPIDFSFKSWKIKFYLKVLAKFLFAFIVEIHFLETITFCAVKNSVEIANLLLARLSAFQTFENVLHVLLMMMGC